MALSDQADKLAEYQARLEAGQADRISPSHVDRVIAKLEAKRAKLSAKLAASAVESERERLRRKLAKSEALIEQARWLRDQI